jgi:hypothetical protein
VTQADASALLTVHIKDPDPARAGRAFSRAAVELALASYPGFTLTAPPGEGSPFGVFRAEYVPAESVDHTAVLPDGTRVAIAPPKPTGVVLEMAPPTTADTGHRADPARAARHGDRRPFGRQGRRREPRRVGAHR